jgi:putative addiction module killer protein
VFRVTRIGASLICVVIRQHEGASFDCLYPHGYTERVYQLRQTDAFEKWLAALDDRSAKARILARLDSVRLGNLGDWKAIGGSLRELRVHAGPGYRLYFVQRQNVVILLLCGGSKSTQARDIGRAKRLLKEIEGQGYG